MMQSPERSVAISYVAWTCLVGAVYILTLVIYPSIGDLFSGNAYIAGVFKRSLSSSFQSFLLVGWIALIPHVLWFRTNGTYKAEAYSNFSLWLQTVFTSLGFLGTIVGVSIAVGGLAQAMLEQSPETLISGLSTAFDTTFLGLVAALTLMLLRKVLTL